MIQSLKKLSLVVLLIICFFFTQRGLVYAQGVTIDFSSFNSGGVQINTTSWGNNNTPSSQPTPSTLTSGVTTTTSITTTNTRPTTNFTNCTAGQFPYNPIDTTELMKELVQPVTFSSLSENEQLLPDAEPYIVTVCLSYNNFPLAGGCSSTVTSEHAGEKLATILLNRYFNGSEPRPFRVVMQSMMTLDHQKQVLQQIEIHAVTIIESRIFKAHGTLIKEYEKISKEEAERGVNWSHKSNDENSIYEFNTKKAFTRLHNIANQEKNLTSNKFINN